MILSAEGQDARMEVFSKSRWPGSKDHPKPDKFLKPPSKKTQGKGTGRHTLESDIRFGLTLHGEPSLVGHFIQQLPENRSDIDLFVVELLQRDS